MKEIWLIVGSQHLYGESTLEEVRSNSYQIAEFLSEKTNKKIVFKDLVVDKEGCNNLLGQVDSTKKCIGVIVWAHTFSPAKMWISAIKHLRKPVLHLSTQYDKEIPYSTINMDYMNTNQSAHGDRELSYAFTVAKKNREIVVGYYKDKKVIDKINLWIQTCIGINHSNNLRMVRFGDNMNNVADTDGNKVLAEMQLGWTIHTVGIHELVEYVSKVAEKEVEELFTEYEKLYDFSDEVINSTQYIKNIKYQAKLEIAIEKYLVENKYTAFTTNFDNLEGLEQLPGLACQRLMAKGYGFAAEGDWKTSALVNITKKMTNNNGTSFMEDYIYDFERELILQSHMLEICPTISKDKPIIGVHPLAIGNKKEPARLKFIGKEASGIAFCLIENFGSLRMIIQEVEVVRAPKSLPYLPVAATFWKVKPNFTEGITAWMYAGGMHHTVYTSELTTNQIVEYCRNNDIEYFVIDDSLNLEEFRRNVGC